MNFLNIKKKIMSNFVFNISCFLRVYIISSINKKSKFKTKREGGFHKIKKKLSHFISRAMLFSTLIKCKY